MKVRGLSALVTVIVLAILVLVGSRYQKSKNIIVSDDMKSQLTPNDERKNSSESAPKGLRAVIAGNLQKQEEMTERKEFGDSTILAIDRVYTEAEINEMSQTQFKSLLEETEGKLPLLSDIKKLPDGALHRTPAPIMQAGKDLGLLKEVLKAHESYEPDALKFYEKCAQNAARPTPVRALCLTNIVIIKKKNGEQINLKAYPSELVELTKLITDM